MIGGMCVVCMCMSVLCLRGGCMFCLTFPALAFSYLFDVRNASSLSAFKQTVLNKDKVPIVPLIYLEGNRYLSVLHARIRNNCSDLNFDLFRNNLSQSPYCTCNSIDYENSEHYFFCCSSYNNQRVKLFQDTRSFHPLSIEIVLFGNKELSYEENIIFKAVQNFIRESKRFNRT